MNKDVAGSFDTYFGKLDDPRIERHKLYPLVEVLFIVLCGSICGAESWRDYVLFGKEKLDFLREHYPFINGIPCKNTFARVLATLDPEAFKHCFIERVKTLQKTLNEVFERRYFLRSETFKAKGIVILRSRLKRFTTRKRARSKLHFVPARSIY